MSLLLGAIMLGSAMFSAGSADKAEGDADDLAKFQGLLDVESMKQDSYLNEYNERRDLASIESSQVAMASAMGKRASGGSFDRMQEVARDDLDANVTRSRAEIRKAEKYGRVSDSARRSASDSRSTGRSVGVITSGLMSMSKALA